MTCTATWREWVADWWHFFSNQPVTDPIGASPASVKINRGSSWQDDENKARSSHRGGFAATSWHAKVGFRLAYMQVNAPPSSLDSIAVLSIAENQPIGTVVGQLNATDPDGDALTFTHSYRTFPPKSRGSSKLLRGRGQRYHSNHPNPRLRDEPDLLRDDHR